MSPPLRTDALAINENIPPFIFPRQVFTYEPPRSTDYLITTTSVALYYCYIRRAINYFLPVVTWATSKGKFGTQQVDISITTNMPPAAAAHSIPSTPTSCDKKNERAPAPRPRLHTTMHVHARKHAQPPCSVLQTQYARHFLPYLAACFSIRCSQPTNCLYTTSNQSVTPETTIYCYHTIWLTKQQAVSQSVRQSVTHTKEILLFIAIATIRYDISYNTHIIFIQFIRILSKKKCTPPLLPREGKRTIAASGAAPPAAAPLSSAPSSWGRRSPPPAWPSSWSRSGSGSAAESSAARAGGAFLDN